LPLAATAYRFESQTGESYVAIAVVDDGASYDWSFNLIAANQLSNFASIAWAPGSLDGSRNDNPIWITPIADTRIYVKYDGNLADQSSLLSPCNIPYDITFTLDELDFRRLLDASDNDQSGMAIFTCDGTPIAAIYGEDPSTAVTGSPSLDVGTTIQPLCIDPVIIANNDIVTTIIDVPVVIDVLDNDRPFLTNLDSTSVSIVSSPTNGNVTVNPDGTISYFPDSSYFGADQFQYFVCSDSDPDLCDFATVFVTILSCDAALTQKIFRGIVFEDLNQNGDFDAENGIQDVTVNIYNDLDEDGTISAGDTIFSSEVTNILGRYTTIIDEQVVATITEDFSSGDYTGGSGWVGNWIEQGDGGTNPVGGSMQVFNNEWIVIDDNRNMYRNFNLTGYSGAELSFDYRRDALEAGENLTVEISTDNGGSWTPVFTIFGNGGTDLININSGNIDLTPYVGGNARIRFLPSGLDWFAPFRNDDMYIDNIVITATNVPSFFVIEVIDSTVTDGFIATTVSTQAFSIPAGGTCEEADFGFVNLCALGLDSDFDGVSDVCDLDDDNDGILDTDEHSPCDSVRVLGYDALWNFEGNSNDESVNNFNAQNTPGITYSSNSAAGDSSVILDGSTFIQYSNGIFLNQAISFFSYSFWFNPASFSGIQYLLDEGGTGNGMAIRLNGNFLEAISLR